MARIFADAPRSSMTSVQAEIASSPLASWHVTWSSATAGNTKTEPAIMKKTARRISNDKNRIFSPLRQPRELTIARLRREGCSAQLRHEMGCLTGCPLSGALYGQGSFPLCRRYPFAASVQLLSWQTDTSSPRGPRMLTDGGFPPL